MRFTARTYRAALRRSRQREVQAWQDHVRAVRGPHAWIEAASTTFRIIERHRRERPRSCHRERMAV